MILSLTLREWLAHTERLHAFTIDLGLERVSRVRDAMGLHPPFPLITVAGTNGKGSTCAFLSAILARAGYRVGLYTSPHLLRYNERIQIGGREVNDELLCQAFAQVEHYRGDIPLTPFEFGTLAALWTFLQCKVDVAVLEVGLGGRLDAVNCFDPDCAIVTSIALDHESWLGCTREAIGIEKAGIFRAGRPAICADPAPPATIAAAARATGAEFFQLGENFWVEPFLQSWRFRCLNDRITSARSFYSEQWITLPQLRLQGTFQYGNAAAALAALHCLEERVPVSMQSVLQGLELAVVKGRFQRVAGAPEIILDVAHNPHAAAALAHNLTQSPCAGKTWAVFAMLADKDIRGVVLDLAGLIDGWYGAAIDEARGAPLPLLMQQLRGVRGRCLGFASVAQAYAAARAQAQPQDRIVVFGSFVTVAAVMSRLNTGS